MSFFLWVQTIITSIIIIYTYINSFHQIPLILFLLDLNNFLVTLVAVSSACKSHECRSVAILRSICLQCLCAMSIPCLHFSTKYIAYDKCSCGIKAFVCYDYYTSKYDLTITLSATMQIRNVWVFLCRLVFIAQMRTTKVDYYFWNRSH